MSGALFRNVAGEAARLIRRNAAAVDPNGLAISVVSRLQSRPYIRSHQLLGRAKETRISPSSGFCSSSSSSSSSSFASVGFVGWYLGMLKSRPVLTKTVTSTLIYTAADLSSQTITKTSSESFDLVRTANVAGYGLILGPALHFWFNSMSRFFPKRDLISTFKKTALAQMIGPTIAVIFFSLNAFLLGESGLDMLARFKRDYLPEMLNIFKYWPISNFITFKFFPVHLQPLVSNSFSYLWTIYMTYMGSREKPDAISSLNTQISST